MAISQATLTVLVETSRQVIQLKRDSAQALSNGDHETRYSKLVERAELVAGLLNQVLEIEPDMDTTLYESLVALQGQANRALQDSTFEHHYKLSAFLLSSDEFSDMDTLQHFITKLKP